MSQSERNIYDIFLEALNKHIIYVKHQFKEAHYATHDSVHAFIENYIFYLQTRKIIASAFIKEENPHAFHWILQ